MTAIAERIEFGKQIEALLDTPGLVKIGAGNVNGEGMSQDGNYDYWTGTAGGVSGDPQHGIEPTGILTTVRRRPNGSTVVKQLLVLKGREYPGKRRVYKKGEPVPLEFRVIL